MEVQGIHALHIPSVVDAIMSYLSVSDLLVARQICQQWYEEASRYLNHQAHVSIYRPEQVNQINKVARNSSMFKYPLQFQRVYLEAELDPTTSPQSYHIFFHELASHVRSLTLKQKWNSPFPLNLIGKDLEELSLIGNLNSTIGIFPTNGNVPYLNNLKKIIFNFEGRITEPLTLQIFANNVCQVLKAAPKLEMIISPQKLDHRDETVDSYRDDTANHILLHLLAADKDISLSNLRRLEIDAKLLDYDLALLGRTATKLPELDTLRIALSPVATRNNLVYVLRKYSKKLKNLTILFSKTHGIRMSLTSFFIDESPLTQLETLSLKNYPASVSIVGSLKNLKKFRLEVRNIEDCFPSDRDEFFLQPMTSFHKTTRSSSSSVPPSPSECNGSSDNSASSSSSIDSNNQNNSTNDSRQYSTPSSPQPAHVDPSKVHGLTCFEYVHNKEGNKIHLYSDKTHYAVARRIAMRFPLLRILHLDNMTEESLVCIIKYLPLLEELHALGGFYSDLALIGANKEDMNQEDFPKTRKLPYIGDLKFLHTLSIGTFAQNSNLCNTELLSNACVNYGVLDCKLLRKFTLGSETRAQSKFETNVKDDAIIALLQQLNLTELKTVKCPFTQSGFNEILKICKERGIKYSINGYEGPIRPWEFVRNERLRKPKITLKRLRAIDLFDELERLKKQPKISPDPTNTVLTSIGKFVLTHSYKEFNSGKRRTRMNTNSSSQCRVQKKKKQKQKTHQRASNKNRKTSPRNKKSATKMPKKQNPTRQVRKTIIKNSQSSSSKSISKSSSFHDSGSTRLRAGQRTSPRHRKLIVSQVKYELRSKTIR